MKIQKRSKSLEILLAICERVEWFATVLEHPYRYSPTSFQSSYRPYSGVDRKQLQRLRKGKYITQTRSGTISMTKMGITVAVIACMHHRPIAMSGKLCVIVFDIPERLRWMRRWFRELFRSLDFQMEQRSVWVGTYDIAQHILFLAALNGAQRFIKVYYSTEVRLGRK